MPWEPMPDNYRKPVVLTADFKMLEDDDVMPYGQHKKKGTKMKDVPAKDLFWLRDNNRASKSVINYIARNYDRLKAEVDSLR